MKIVSSRHAKWKVFLFSLDMRCTALLSPHPPDDFHPVVYDGSLHPLESWVLMMLRRWRADDDARICGLFFIANLSPKLEKSCHHSSDEVLRVDWGDFQGLIDDCPSAPFRRCPVDLLNPPCRHDLHAHSDRLRFFLRYEVLILLPMRHKICPAKTCSTENINHWSVVRVVCRSRKTPGWIHSRKRIGISCCNKTWRKKVHKNHRIWKKKVQQQIKRFMML